MHRRRVELVLDAPEMVEALDRAIELRAFLFGQLGDPRYLQKVHALYYEFEEAGINKKYGYSSTADLTELYPQFYFKSLSSHLETAIRYLNVTTRGRQWIASLA